MFIRSYGMKLTRIQNKLSSESGFYTEPNTLVCRINLLNKRKSTQSISLNKSLHAMAFPTGKMCLHFRVGKVSLLKILMKQTREFYHQQNKFINVIKALNDKKRIQQKYPKRETNSSSGQRVNMNSFLCSCYM